MFVFKKNFVAARYRQKKKIRKVDNVKQRYTDAMYSAFEGDCEEFIMLLARTWERQKNTFTYKEIRQAVMRGEVSAENIIKWQNEYSSLINKYIKPKYQNIAGEKGGRLKEKLKTYEYDSHDLELNKWIDTQCASLVTMVTDEQQSAIAAMIKAAQSKRMTVDETARLIRPCFGLNKPQAVANANYYETVKNNLLKSNPKMRVTTAEKRAREAAVKYAEKQHRYRAQMIARTELVSANNRAYVETIKDAVKKGVMGNGVFVWDCTADENSCETCMALDGTEVAIGGKFPIKGTERVSGQFEAPPAHPNCGCALCFEERKTNEEKEVENFEESGIINYARAKDVFLFGEDDIPMNATIKPDDIIKNLETTEIGNDTIEYMINNHIYPYLIYEPQMGTDRGDQEGRTIKIYMSNINSPRVAAQTVIHEVTHLRYDIGNCQWAEAVCMAKEKMHLMNRTYLTAEEKRYVVNLARDNYPYLNWKKGGYKYGKRM